MTIQTVCDGCKVVIRKTEITIEGNRANGLGGGGLPDGDFHWCLTCSEIAFRAVKDCAEVKR